MAGLVSYGSSDEEDDIGESSAELKAPDISRAQSSNEVKEDVQINGKISPPRDFAAETEAPMVGPALGPSVNTLQDETEEESGIAPQSPYTANRSLLRQLTLPTLPNYDIPASPPGSPKESTNAKFKHFLKLKKQGVHFNEKLSKSSAVKNPSLMEKLLDFSGIDEVGQYSTTLPKELWDPSGFPEYAFKEELAKSQQRILKKREDEKTRGQRESVDFVPASTSEPPSRTGTPGVGRPIQKSTAERVMAGLDKNRSNSPQVQNLKRKSRFDN